MIALHIPNILPDPDLEDIPSSVFCDLKLILKMSGSNKAGCQRRGERWKEGTQSFHNS